jgi:hypothetical protein
MSRTPRLTGPDPIAARGKGGFHPLRVKGSPRFLRHQDGNLAGQTDLRDCQLTTDKLIEFLQRR